jgi:hypothetical protein
VRRLDRIGGAGLPRRSLEDRSDHLEVPIRLSVRRRPIHSHAVQGSPNGALPKSVDWLILARQTELFSRRSTNTRARQAASRSPRLAETIAPIITTCSW